MLNLTMTGTKRIPLFPLGILPIPKELIPLHIFEPRYKQLIEDVMEHGNTFGIIFDHPSNKDNLGAVVRVESILKEYDTGETDVVVQCLYNFTLNRFYPKFKDRLYPGGEIVNLQNQDSGRAGDNLKRCFENYLKQRDDSESRKVWRLHDIANMLHMETNDRINYIKARTPTRREAYLEKLIGYHFFILEQENKSKTKFFLN